MYMQQDKGSTTSECIVTFDEFIVLADQIATNVGSDADYLAGILAKGQGEGTSVGFQIDKFQSYFDAGIYSVNVFNYCDLDYYLMAIGKSTGSTSGFFNQLVNLGYRFFDEDDAIIYYNMSVAIGEDDTDEVGKNFGLFLSAFLMVEVPDTTTAPDYQRVPSVM